MATFVTKFKKLTIVQKPITRQMHSSGLVETVPGKDIIFENGQYETTDKSQVYFLRHHKKKGLLYHEIDGPDEIKKDDSVDVVARKQVKANQMKKRIASARVKLPETDESDEEEYRDIKKKTRVAASK